MQIGNYIWDKEDRKEYASIECKITDVLLSTKSSTTRLLEAITGVSMEVEVLNQKMVSSEMISDECRVLLEKSKTYLKRNVSLRSQEDVFSDNIVFGSTKYISKDIIRELYKGNIPLGKLVKNCETRRELIWTGNLEQSYLYDYFPQREYSLTKYPAKKYLIYVGSHCCFYLLEVFHINTILRYFFNS